MRTQAACRSLPPRRAAGRSVGRREGGVGRRQSVGRSARAVGRRLWRQTPQTARTRAGDLTHSVRSTPYARRRKTSGPWSTVVWAATSPPRTARSTRRAHAPARASAADTDTSARERAPRTPLTAPWRTHGRYNTVTLPLHDRHLVEQRLREVRVGVARDALHRNVGRVDRARRVVGDRVLAVARQPVEPYGI